MQEKLDCIIVGGGIAGLSAAMVLARANVRFILFERGAFSGEKNVSGGVLWGTDLERLVPGYSDDEEAGFERFINHRRLSFLDEGSSFSVDFKSDHFNEKPYRGISVLRAKFDAWLAEKVQAAIDESAVADESFLIHEVLVDKVLQDENGKATGVRAASEEFFADCVIIAEGVNNLLTRQVGLQKNYVPAAGMATGVKEVIRFEKSVLEDRFQLDGRSGLTNEFIGFASGGVEGGGFLYTNENSVSLGLVLSLESLRDAKVRAYDLLNDFKQHPAVRDMLRGGEVVEYSAHVVSTGDMAVMPTELYADGLMLTGEAANLLMNSGKAIQGMDYAMRSGILAAETVIEARDAADFSSSVLKAYRDKLESCFVLQDMRRFQDAVHFLHSETMFKDVPNVMCEFGRQFFTIENKPAQKTRQMFRDAARKHSSVWKLVKTGIKAGRAL